MTDTESPSSEEPNAESPTPQQSELDYKINLLFGGSVVRKDLVKAVKGNAIVPSYVLEYLLGQYAASDDEATIHAGIDAVRKILADHYVHRNESELVKSTIREKGRHRIIDKVTVTLNDKQDVYQASFANLGLTGVIVEPATVKANPKLLVGGVWCICDIEYFHSDDARVVPWILGSLKPIQMSSFDYEGYLASRKGFNTEEWIDLLIQSIGFNPEMFGRRAKLLQLVRLIPFVERNYNLVELGPKGTGKSHIYSEFSPHGMLISGGEVTVPKLFVNNANGRIGLVGYWDVVAFDEFAGKKKRTDKALVDIMKNYMANKSFSRGVETLGAEASMVFVGNTSHNVPYMLKHSDLFDELPEAYHDSAYLDRLHFYIPGWEVDTIRSEMFSSGYGFVVDYIAEVLRSMRNTDYSDRYQQHFTLGSDISTRDRDGIHKTFSGLMKLIYPGGEATQEEIEELLRFAVEGRKRVKDQILRIDTTMAAVNFGYSDKTGAWRGVTTLEEDEYPDYYQARRPEVEGEVEASAEEPRSAQAEVAVAAPVAPQGAAPLFEGHREFQENQRGVSYETLLMPYLRGATDITIVDPYIRLPHQGRNLVDLLALLAAGKDPADEIAVTLVTKEDRGEYGKPVTDRVTDTTGSYSFDDLPALPPGTHYKVTIDYDKSPVLEDLHLVPTTPGSRGNDTDPTNDYSHTDSAESSDLTEDGAEDPTLDFGFRNAKVSVGDYVWIDVNRDGLQDASDVPLKGVVLALTGPDGKPVTDVFGNPVEPTSTDGRGRYEFRDLPVLSKGTSYTVTIVKDDPSTVAALKGLVPTTAGAGTDQAADSSTDTVASWMDLSRDGAHDPTLDFGFQRAAVKVGDYVWLDSNRNGKQNASEKGIEGVWLELRGPDGKPVIDVNGLPVKPVATDASGHYEFAELPVLAPGQSYTTSIMKKKSRRALKGLYPTVTKKGSKAIDSSTDTSVSWKPLTTHGAQDMTLDYGFYSGDVGGESEENPEVGAGGDTGGTGGQVSGEQNLPDTGSRIGWWTLGAALLLLIAGAGVLLRRRRES